MANSSIKATPSQPAYDPTKSSKYQETEEIKQLRQAVANRQAQVAHRSADAGLQQWREKQLADIQGRLSGAINNSAKGMNADGSSFRPDFNSQIDPATGLIKSNLQIKPGADVTADQRAIDEMRAQALGSGPSKYATLAEQKQRMGEEDQMNSARQQLQGQQNQAQSNLAMRGGISSGARERLAMGGGRDAFMAQQGINRQGQTDRLNIGLQDQQMKNQALQNVSAYDMQNANLGMQNRQYQTDVQRQNIGATQNELLQNRAFDSNVYNQDMAKWGAGKSADAQASAGSGGGGLCCFIFMEARYGDGTMDSVVRRFRDEHMTDRNKRGYYKLSEVLVPLMRKSKAIKVMVRIFMTDPLVSYGNYYYGKGNLGRIFSPLKTFWLKMFDYLGQDHEFIRENGEVV